MASIGELLHHLVEHAPGLYEDGKRLFHDVIDAEFPPKEAPAAVSRETPPETPVRQVPDQDTPDLSGHF